MFSANAISESLLSLSNKILSLYFFNSMSLIWFGSIPLILITLQIAQSSGRFLKSQLNSLNVNLSLKRLIL